MKPVYTDSEVRLEEVSLIIAILLDYVETSYYKEIWKSHSWQLEVEWTWGM